MAEEHVVSGSTSKGRHISDLSRNPMKPLTQEQRENLSDYMSHKNRGKSATQVSLSNAYRIVSGTTAEFLFKSEAV